jgi:hypothetical protein
VSDTLFPIAPDEPTKRKPARKAAPKPAEAAAPALPPRERKPAIKPVGQIDGEPCDGRAFGEPCGTTLRDIFYEDRDEWLTGCWVCGCVRWMPVVPGHLPERSTFVVHGGRFDGLTFDEIAEQPRGMDTIRLYAADAKKPTIQREAKKWLDDRAGNQ